MLKSIAIDLLSVLAILSSMVLIPVLVIAVVAVGIGLFKWMTEKMLDRADKLSDSLYERLREDDDEDKT